MVAVTASAAALENRPPESASVVFSDDSETVVLFIQMNAATARDVRSLSVFGDGRVVLSRGPDGESPIDTKETRLARAEVEDLLELCIVGRLASYDPMSLNARRRTALGGRPFSAPDGAPTLAVMFQVENARLGDTDLGRVRGSVTEFAVDLGAETFPGFPEYRSLAALQSYLLESFRREGMPLR